MGRSVGAAAVLLAACSSPAPLLTASTCAVSCPDGLTCAAGRCAPQTCGDGTGCPGSLTCIGGYCASTACSPPCGTGFVCFAQVCIPAGASSCGSASDCPAGDTCVNGGCSSVANGGACAAPYTTCSSASGTYCANLARDSNNCGVCGQACPAGEVCDGVGVCSASCVASETLCGGRCVALQSDDNNCGACGTACPAGQACSGGACAATCASPYTTCGSGAASYCADEQSDPENCGACGLTCGAGTPCVAGACGSSCPSPFVLCGSVCTDTTWDPNNCGGCGTACPNGDCRRGACVERGTATAASGTSAGASSSGAMVSATSGAMSGTASGTISGVTSGATSGGDSGTVTGGTTSGVGGVNSYTTVALGGGQLGGAGNVDGVGQAARFSYPTWVAVDDGGFLYLSDSGNVTIRAINLATGAVTTLAGGIRGEVDGYGPDAGFFAPLGIAWDGRGNLYVGDSAPTIRKVTIATGQVQTIAGAYQKIGTQNGAGAAAEFSAPVGVVFDGIGDLYVADESILREVVLSSDAVSTLAGEAGKTGYANGAEATSKFDEPQAMAYDGMGNLYIADEENNAIRLFDISSGQVSTPAGSTATGAKDGIGAAATFDHPQGVFLDSTGELYIADTYNNLLRVMTTSSMNVTTLAGQAGVAGALDQTGKAATFDWPTGVVGDGQGNLYIADQLNNVIREYDIASQAVSTPFGAVAHPGSANGLGAAAQFDSPLGIAGDGQGHLFVADSVNDTIREITLSNFEVTTLAGSPGDAGFANGTGASALFDTPYGVACDDGGNVFVTDEANHTLRQIDIASGTVSTLAGNPANGSTVDGTGGDAGFQSPNGIVWDGQGHLYVAEAGGDVVREVTVATAQVVTIAGKPQQQGATNAVGSAARFYDPYGVALDGQGNLYVSDTGNYTIRQIALATNNVTTLAGTVGVHGSRNGVGTAAEFFNPLGLVYDGAGHLLVADSANGTIREIDLATQQVSLFAGIPGQHGAVPGSIGVATLNQPSWLAYVPGTGLFVTEAAENAVLQLY